MLCSLLLALLSFPCLRLSGFKEIYGSRRLRAATPLLMGVSYPYSIKNVVTKMTESMQKALQARTIRIEVELPANAEYGVEVCIPHPLSM